MNAAYLPRLFTSLKILSNNVDIISFNPNQGLDQDQLRSTLTLASDADWTWRYPGQTLTWQCRIRTEWLSGSEGIPQMECLEVIVDSFESDGTCKSAMPEAGLRMLVVSRKCSYAGLARLMHWLAC